MGEGSENAGQGSETVAVPLLERIETGEDIDGVKEAKLLQQQILEMTKMTNDAFQWSITKNLELGKLQDEMSALRLQVRQYKKDWAPYVHLDPDLYELNHRRLIVVWQLRFTRKEFLFVRSMMQDIDAKLVAHGEALTKCRDRVESATSAEELTDVPIPDLNWFKSIPDPGVDKLVETWERINIQGQMTYIHGKLVELVTSD